jgi:peptidoglycan/LPS O-acetylase OafA/YrhL
MRGLAAFWVFGMHLTMYRPTSFSPFGTFFSQGAIGVDVFFVLSGFILSSVYEGITRSEIPGFLKKRFFRVYPLHFVTMLAMGVLVAAAPLLHIRLLHETAHCWRVFPFALLMLHPYIGQGGNWNGPSWSIAVEFPCYFAFPFLQHVVKRISFNSLTIIFTLLVTAQSLFLFSFGEPANGAGSLVRALLGFGVGMASKNLSNAFRPSRLVGKICEPLLALTMVVLILLKGAEFVPAISAFMFIFLSWNLGFVSALLSTKALYGAGTISFSIYLVQGPIIAILRSSLRIVWQRGHIHVPEATFAWTFVLLCSAVTLLVSHWTWRFIEVPARAWGRATRPKPQSITSGQSLVPQGNCEI